MNRVPKCRCRELQKRVTNVAPARLLDDRVTIRDTAEACTSIEHVGLPSLGENEKVIGRRENGNPSSRKRVASETAITPSARLVTRFASVSCASVEALRQ
jgi:hypothetical protein